MSKRNLPVKLIMQRSSDITKNNGGGKDKFFCEVNKELQDKLINQLDELGRYYKEIFEENSKMPVIGKIKIKDKAIAKSHKPDKFVQNIPIIGSEELDEVYVKVTKEGLNKTIDNVRILPSKKFKANLTVIDNIQPYYNEEKISETIKEYKSDKLKKGNNKLKIRLFNFNNEYDDMLINNYVLEKLKEISEGKEVKVVSYGDRLKFIKCEVDNYNDVLEISKINGIRKIDIISSYHSATKEFIESEKNLKLKCVNEETDTIIGIIDSGISDNNPYITPYIYGREQYVGDDYINSEHGTFVASTIQYTDILNGFKTTNNKRFKFLDVIALPNSNENYGPVDSISEDELMEIIEEVVSKYHLKVKIWNLSLGNENKICNGSMSDLGIFCDYIQDKYNVQFFISSGNKNTYPLRQWPSQLNDDSDRIISPADSVRAVTVGAVASKDSSYSVVKIKEPSPFSRRGPGANYIIKPDVVDIGGNCTNTGDCRDLGVSGLDQYGHIVENIGTSFSTPRVVRKYATIYDEIVDNDILMAKALLIHSAKINSIDYVNRDTTNYFGYGIPHNELDEILKCSENEISLIFKQSVIEGSHLELIDFPYPKSLIRDEKCFGEIFMTLVYNPPLNSDYGKEYCRSNIDVSFGPIKFATENSKADFKSEVLLDKKWDSKFEKELVENGFKWSPIKSYHRKIVNGIKAKDGWKLRIDLTSRYNETVLSQEFVLIVTIKDVDGKADVYNEVVNGLRENGYIMSDVETRAQVRSRR